MPTETVVPTSDITTTDWGRSSGSGPLSGVLAANGGSVYVSMSGGSSSNPLEMGTGFSTDGMSAITAVGFSVSWEDFSKSVDADFLITLLDFSGTLTLASMSAVQSSSTSEITSTGSLTFQTPGLILGNWSSFQIRLQSGTIGGDGNTDGLFYGLSLTVTYAVGAAVLVARSINNSQFVAGQMAAW
jgi:hypothetical protein